MSGPARKQRRQAERDAKKAAKRMGQPTSAELARTIGTLPSGRQITGAELQAAIRWMPPDEARFVQGAMVQARRTNNDEVKQAVWRTVEAALEEMDRPKPAEQSDA